MEERALLLIDRPHGILPPPPLCALLLEKWVKGAFNRLIKRKHFFFLKAF